MDSRRRRRRGAALLLAVTAALVAAAGCGAGTTPPPGEPSAAPGGAPGTGAALESAPSEAVRTFERDGALWLEREGAGPQPLADDGRAYDAHVSPDGRWIAVDVVMFSNLQVTRLLRREDATGAYVPAANLSTEAWSRAAAALGFAVEDIENARSSFAGWDDTGGAALVEITGDAPGDVFVERLERVPLPGGP